MISSVSLGYFFRDALTTFAGQGDKGRGSQSGETEPAKPQDELLTDLRQTITLVRGFLLERGASLDDVITKTHFERNAAILIAKEAANTNDETRKRFEVRCREVFKKFKACINVKGVNAHRAEHGAINIIYKSLQEDREKADITDIISQLHREVGEAIYIQQERGGEDTKPYDISKIDFERLRNKVERYPARRTTVQNLKQAIEPRLKGLLERNPRRANLQHHYEEIVAKYNREKDPAIIENTLEALLRFVGELDEEGSRAGREALDEEALAVFDLLKKPDLSEFGIERIKCVAVGLLKELKVEKLRIDHRQDKEATRDAVRTVILDFLWDEKSGLPVDYYSEDDVKESAEEIFRHVYRVYPTILSPYYANT